jgi:hypothetical protein
LYVKFANISFIFELYEPIIATNPARSEPLINEDDVLPLRALNISAVIVIENIKRIGTAIIEVTP